MTEKDDIKFMKRCLELASKAEGLTYPNPLVGSVIVNGGKIIGEGYHLKAGGPHAEVNAINSVQDKSKLKTSTLYVNLEPCSHFGRTPPCADLIVSEGIPRVVIGTIDTSAKVSGKGMTRLKDAGCEVISGVVEEGCRRLNRRFFTFIEKKRPYITLKWAQSADGYLDIRRPENAGKKPTWISGKPERVLVHKWRSEEEAILVGAGTVRADDPKLNVRDWAGNDPVKIILSNSGMFGNELSMIKTGSKLIVFTTNMGADIPGAIKVKLTDDIPSAQQITRYLFNNGIQSLLVEGGAMVLDHFTSVGLWDEARIFTGRTFFNEGVKAPLLTGKIISEENFDTSLLSIYVNNGS
ncbi:MAG TPA: bifunctional diaminohydroxyphosphoribosylaminopyrimidine deaminase/5-amino-6-(5-phosphoribosylamino)uracil reductase RibD [Bacteroidales bacterium]|nr:bifunctional diaminohydroxyphosphoribosylaminopyrimidine deaminase/5-amino-6-(5-phosphoribosylamino)uracil reductase RibD [Bacteroidales bacterium]